MRIKTKQNKKKKKKKKFFILYIIIYNYLKIFGTVSAIKLIFWY